MRRSAWLWCPAAVLFIALTLPAAASAETYLGAINVPLDGSKVYSAPLVAGGVYRIAASGTYTQTGGPGNPVERDALYCFNYVASPPAGCSQSMPVRQYPVAVLYEGNTSLTADLDALNPATTLAYNPLHTYQETFTAASSTRLEIFCRMCNPFYSYSGGIRLDPYLVSLPPASGAGGGGGGGAGGSGGGGVLKILEPAVAWGNPSPQAAMAPGDSVIATSPSIGPRERGVTVTLSGDGSGQTAVVFGTPGRFKKGKITGGDCVRAAVGLYGHRIGIGGDPVYPPYLPKTQAMIRSEALFNFTVFLIACLDLVKELDKRAHQAAVTSAAGAFRVACKLSAYPVSVRIDRAAGRSSWRTRRASRREPVRRLRGSCQQARNGTVRVHIRTASKRVKLRKVLGPRLVVGAYRSTAASGTANVRATFTRR